MMNPRDITPVLDSPLNRLIFAINHYVSTGDHIGEGIATAEGDRMRMMIPINLSMPQDQRDLDCFRSRFDELRDKYHLTLGYMGANEQFEMWSFLVREDQMDDLALDLRRQPGALGWGSCKAVIDAHNWEEP